MSSNQKNLELITAESVKNMYLPKSDNKPKLTKKESSFYNIFDINMRKNEINNNKINKNEINKNEINYKYIIIILILLIGLIIFIVLYILENKKYSECQFKYKEYKTN